MAKEALQLEFGNGEYDFRLNLRGINEIQEKCGCGVGRVWSRLAASRFDMIPGDAETNVGVPNVADFRMEDVIEPIRQGLIGGGKGTVDGEPVTVTNAVANRLIENYVLDAPLAESWKIAFFLMNALIEGYDPPKKKVEPEAETETTTDDSTTQEPLPTA